MVEFLTEAESLALLGKPLFGDLNGCAGFGETADAAMWDFDKNWVQQRAPQPSDAGKEQDDAR